MAKIVKSIQSLDLHELIGGPLAAMVQADAHAARTTLEYLEAVGFSPAETGDDTPQEKTDIGKLRMAQFKFKKLDENNQATDFVASVPILSLVPIPALQIKEGKISFSAKITDIAKDNATSNQGGNPMRAAVAGSSLISNIRAQKVKLFAKPAASSGTKDQEVRGTFHINIEVTAAQADITSGMEKIFNLLDQAINEEKTNSSQ